MAPVSAVGLLTVGWYLDNFPKSRRPFSLDPTQSHPYLPHSPQPGGRYPTASRRRRGSRQAVLRQNREGIRGSLDNRQALPGEQGLQIQERVLHHPSPLLWLAHLGATYLQLFGRYRGCHPRYDTPIYTVGESRSLAKA